MVGGDQLTIDVTVGAGAHALTTTPGAAKCYRSAGPVAAQRQTLTVSAGGVLEWLPQETILFPGALIDLATSVAHNGDARFIGWDIACLGRPSNVLGFDQGQAVLRLDIARDSRPLLRERLAVTGGQGLGALSGLRGFPVTATFLASGASADGLAAARAALPPDSAALIAGITRLDDLLVARAGRSGRAGDAVFPAAVSRAAPAFARSAPLPTAHLGDLMMRTGAGGAGRAAGNPIEISWIIALKAQY